MTSQNEIALYVHAHWNYNHPYAARTWTVEDWNGFLHGLKELGYNAIMIWPMLETMPVPPTPSDKEYLSRLTRVMNMAQHQFGMKVTITLCPNVQANPSAPQYTFEERPFFACDERINPADADALQTFIARRETLLRHIPLLDRVAIIDSDPGGYPDSPDEEFITIIAAHREMLERIRPGIEINYWMLIGWQAYNEWWKTGQLRWCTEAEMSHCVRLLQGLDPQPWGLFAHNETHIKVVEKRGLSSQTLWFPYGVIEGEPTFPMTNYSRHAIGQPHPVAARGVMGNAQTHCVQLPNIFALSRGAQGLSLSENDYINFANDLVKGHGPLIHQSWQSLAGDDETAMRRTVTEVERATQSKLQPGALAGLLLQSPRRFLEDLVLQLRFRAEFAALCQAQEAGDDIRGRLGSTAKALQAWQQRTGFKKPSGIISEKLLPVLRTIDDEPLQEALRLGYDFPDEWTGWSDQQRNHYCLQQEREFYPELIAAMKRIGTQ